MPDLQDVSETRRRIRRCPEMTLSVSCPEVARILLGKKEPVRFLTYESNKEEEYDDFDPFLYSNCRCKKVMIDILQDRDKKLDLRVGLVLAIAHDLQVRIKREDIFSIDDVFEKYQTEKAVQFVEAKLSEDENYAFIKKMFRNQYLMERLRDDWGPHLLEAEVYSTEILVAATVKNNVQSTKNSMQRTNENFTNG